MRRLGVPVVRTYSTRFRVDEEILTEGGIWRCGRRDGSDWTDVAARDGVAFGAVSRGGAADGGYDDPTAVLTGAWGRNQHARGVVYCRNPTDRYYQEVELRLRSALTPRSCTGYEVFWRCLKTGDAYAEIVRWNGRVKDFTSIAKNTGAHYGVKDGDLVEATVVGNEIRGLVNGRVVITARDDVFESGSPGIGFNFGVGATGVDHGFSYYEVTTYD